MKTPVFIVTRQRGNILFLILLAVVLFAALSYAVTSSMRGGGKDAGNENIELVAAQILQYATTIENAVMRLQLTAGCSETQISFWTSSTTQFNNTNAPPEGRCHVFDPRGGGVSSPHGIKSPYLNPQSYFCGAVKVTGINTDATELLFRVTMTSAALCSKINEKLGIGAAGAPPPISTVYTNAGCNFTGDYSTGGHLIGPFMKQSPYGCYQAHTATPNDFIYYHVLIPR